VRLVGVYQSWKRSTYLGCDVELLGYFCYWWWEGDVDEVSKMWVGGGRVSSRNVVSVKTQSVRPERNLNGLLSCADLTGNPGTSEVTQ
jgi:hypothetical protein